MKSKPITTYFVILTLYNLFVNIDSTVDLIEEWVYYDTSHNFVKFIIIVILIIKKTAVFATQEKFKSHHHREYTLYRF